MNNPSQLSKVLGSLTPQSVLDRLQSDSLMRNSLYIMLSTVFTAGLGYFFWIVAARTRTEYEVGLVSSLLSAAALTSGLANLSLGSYLIQTLPKRLSGQEWSLTLNTALVSVTLLSLLGSCVTLAIFALSGEFQDVLHDGWYVLLFVSEVVVTNLFILHDAVFVAERSAGQMLIHNIVFAVSKMILLIGLLLLPAGSLNNMGIFVAWMLGCLLAGLFGMVLITRLQREYHLTGQGMIQEFRKSLTSLIGHHLISAGAIFPALILPIMVAVLLSPIENAYFYMVWTLRIAYSMISVAVSSSLFAEGSYRAETLSRTVRNAAILIAVLLIPVMAIFLIGGEFILSIPGRDYAIYGTTLSMILVISAVPDAITNLYVSVLRVQHRLRDAALLNVAMGILAVGLARLLIIPMGINGVGLAWLLAETGGCLAVLVDVLWNQRSAQRQRPQGQIG